MVAKNIKDKFENRKSNHTFNFSYLVFTLSAAYLIQAAFISSRTVQIPYSEFVSLLQENKIEEISITDDKIDGILKKGPTDESQKRFFKTNRVDAELSNLLQKHNVKYSQIIVSTFLRDVFSWVLPILVFFGLWFFVFRKLLAKSMGGGYMSVGKSKAKVYMEKDTEVTFDDVAGVSEAKEELQEVVEFLKDSKKYSRLGARMPKGILLVGPPGTGKTLFAKAIAGEAKVPFFSISGSEFVEMFVGVGAARVRDLFDQARKSAPCIVFIDELDALGKARGNSPLGGGNDEKEQTLNQLLTELDGFDSHEGVILLAATNRPDSLDPALLRSGRFDRQVLIDKPDRIGRLAILKVHLKKVKFDENLEVDQIAALTTGFTGADLANLVNEAALNATRENADHVQTKHLSLAIERIVAGLEKKNRILNEFERNVVAHHEMGHALVASALNCMDVVHKVSIIPRGMGALGYTIQRPSEDRYILKMDEIQNKISVLMGGRAAEKIIFNHLSTGASDDLTKATNLAKDMVTKYGMVEELGNVVFMDNKRSFLGMNNSTLDNHSESVKKLIDDSIKKIIDASYENALSLLTKNKKVLISSAERLLTEETLGIEQLEEYFAALKDNHHNA